MVIEDNDAESSATSASDQPSGATTLPLLKTSLSLSQTEKMSPSSSGSMGAHSTPANVWVGETVSSPDSTMPSAQIGRSGRRQCPMLSTMVCPIVSKLIRRCGGTGAGPVEAPGAAAPPPSPDPPPPDIGPNVRKPRPMPLPEP